MLGLVVGANAQFKGIGYDNDFSQITGGLSQITGRLALGANFLDLGAGMKFDNTSGVDSDAKFRIAASGFFLGHLHDFGPVDTYFTAGALFAKLPKKTDNISLGAFVGFQPEVTLLDHIVLSTRFGLEIPLVPSFIIQTAGSGISIVQGANFKILF